MSIASRILMAMIRFYQRFISPLTPPTCIYTPTCSEYAIQAIRKYGALKGTFLAAKRIGYISCSSETLSRDLYLLKKCGYKALKIQPVDMFPHTKHIETVTLLQAAKE